MAKKQTRKKTPAKKPAKKTTALVRRPKVVEAQLVPAGGSEGRLVTDGFRLDALGLVELKATPAEEKVLAREPAAIDVMIKPTGQAYLPHQVYTRWLNEAFGRGGWMLVPVGKPALLEKTVTCPYILYVHGRPVAFAQGEQEYHANNREQTYGDALEATVASALRRCCKHLGIALELWDRRWTNAWRSQHAIQVQVETRRKQDDGSWQKDVVTQWRRPDDPPLKGEVGRGRAPRREPDPEQHDKLDEPISPQKRERFWRVARRMGRNEADIKSWLLKHYQVEKTDQITNRHYDRIMRVLESPGPLPNGREAGQEG